MLGSEYSIATPRDQLSLICSGIRRARSDGVSDARLGEWIPRHIIPSPKQYDFINTTVPEVLYGGAAGGGKTWGLCMKALRWAHHPEWRVLYFRQTRGALKQERGPVDTLQSWLRGTAATYNKTDMIWRFPAGGSIRFGHLQDESDLDLYQGGGITLAIFDEVTQFTSERLYTYFWGRLRPLQEAVSMGLPPSQIASGCNPGGAGEAWVYRRFIGNPLDGTRFIPAFIRDNPGVDTAAYLANFERADHITRTQQRDGVWLAGASMRLFMDGWYQRRRAYEHTANGRRVRSWDLARTHGGGDWTVGVLGVRVSNGDVYVADVKRQQLSEAYVRNLIMRTAIEDGYATLITLPEDPALGGAYEQRLAGDLRARGFPVALVPRHINKYACARPLSQPIETGQIKFLERPWTEDLLQELSEFVGDGNQHDDQVDALADMYLAITPDSDHEVTPSLLSRRHYA